MNKSSDYGLATGPTISAPKVSLPNSGAGLNNISQKFQPNLFTGSGTYTYNLNLTQARALTPTLTLLYSTGYGNGVFGQGFNLSYPLITRKTHNGVPTYNDDNDIFIWQGEDLIQKGSAIDNADWLVRYYLPRIVHDYSSIEFWKSKNDSSSHWVVRAPDGVNYIFGTTADSKVVDPADSKHIFNWLLKESIDAKGNRALYNYINQPIQEGNQTYVAYALSEIKYGNYHAKKSPTELFAFRLVFDYGDNTELIKKFQQQNVPISLNGQQMREDSFLNFRAGFGIIYNQLCYHAFMLHQFESEFNNEEILVSYWTFTYKQDLAQAKPLTFLTSVQRTGCCYREDTHTYLTRHAAKEVFTYAGFALNLQNEQLLSFAGSPSPNDISKTMFIDLYREGLPGILYSDENTTLFWRNQGYGHFEPPQRLAKLPIHRGMGVTRYHLSDIEANHSLNLMVVNDSSTGFYKLDNELNWANYRLLPKFPAEYMTQEAQLVDVTGGGKPDLVILQNKNPRYYPNLGLQGYGTAKKITLTDTNFPSGYIPDQRKLVTFANIFGDGMSHRVQVSYNKIEVWPNLGRGTFGRKITLEQAPQFEKSEKDFHPNTLQFVNIDGSGLDSLVYIKSTGLTVYMNQGMKFAKEGIQLNFPAGFKYSSFDRIEFVDVLGQGRTGIVLIQNSKKPTYHYYDLCAAFKPYVLKTIDNSLGSTTMLEYMSSSEQYINDKIHGRKQLSRLPFPVTVVKSITIKDNITGVVVTDSFAYHDGYYDPIEGEFNGFGLVEHSDKNTFDKVPTANDENYTTPIITKVWYHTGAQNIDGGIYHISTQYKDEYFAGDKDQYAMPDSTVILKSVPAQSQYPNVCYTMRGSILRQEIYSDNIGDESAKKNQRLIYSATQHNYTVTAINIGKDNQPGCFAIQARESISYEYDGDVNDPVVHHQLFLKYDDFNNLVQQATIAYPRRIAVDEKFKQMMKDCNVNQKDIDMIVQVNPKQKVLEIIVATNEYGNLERNTDNDNTGKGIFNHHGIILNNTLLDIQDDAMRLLGNLLQKYLPFETLRKYIDHLPASAVTMRHKAFFYRDQSGDEIIIDVNQIKGLPLLHHTEAAVIGDEQARVVYDKSFGDIDAIFTAECGYIKSDGKTWYQSSDVQLYDTKNYFVVDGQQSLNIAILNNPLWRKTEIIYDDYRLAITGVKRYLNGKPVDKNPQMIIDYRSIKPYQLTDVNDIKTQVIYDPLGVVVATTICGTIEAKRQGQLFENRDDLLARLLSLTTLEQIFEQSNSYLNNTLSSMVFYSVEVTDTKNPNWTVSFVRQVDEDPLPSFEVPIPKSQHQTSIKYYNGFGKVTQTKKLANTDQWLVSGFKIHNDKGLVMHQYLPRWANVDAVYKFEPEIQPVSTRSVPPTRNFYDGLNRLVRVIKPDSSLLKTAITPWYVLHYDENDCDDNSFFAKTPVIQILDALGHDIANVQILTDEENPVRTLLVTHFRYNILKQLIAERDPRIPKDNITYTYNMLGKVIKTDSVDRNIEIVLENKYERKLYYHDGRYKLRYTFDQWDRLVKTEVALLNQVKYQAIEKIEYGTPDQSKYNANEKVTKKIDQAGIAGYIAYNLYGKCIRETRQTFTPQEIIGSDIFTDLTNIDISGKLNKELNLLEIYFNNRGQILAIRYPDNSIEVNRYNAMSQLLSVDFYLRGKRENKRTIVTDIEYNEMNQTLSKKFGNNLAVQYAYEQETGRLSKLSAQLKEKIYQDIRYDYDKGGNITRIADNSLNEILSLGQDDCPSDFDYKYDSLYRVRAASSRQIVGKLDTRKEGGDTTTIAKSRFGLFAKKENVNNSNPGERPRFVKTHEAFGFDKGNNVIDKTLTSASKEEIEKYHMEMEDQTNRLKAVQSTGETTLDTHPDYDYSGNISKGLYDAQSEFTWSYKNQMVKFHAAEGEDEYYRYSSEINRMISVSVKDGIITETIHLRSFSIHRTYEPNKVSTVTYTLHVGDHMQQVAAFSYHTDDKDDQKYIDQLIFHLINHLNSVTIDVLEDGQVLNYEDFLAFGDTSFVVTAEEYDFDQKHYRYSSHKRNKTNGLYFFGARYYSPWLGKWVSPDPIGIKDSLNEFEFVRNRPVIGVDRDGFSFEWLKQDKIDAINNSGNFTVHQINHVFMHFDKETKPRLVGMGTITSNHNYAIEVHDESIKDKLINHLTKGTEADISAFRQILHERIGVGNSGSTHFMLLHDVTDPDPKNHKLYIFSSGGMEKGKNYNPEKQSHTEAFGIGFAVEKSINNVKLYGELKPCSQDTNDGCDKKIAEARENGVVKADGSVHKFGQLDYTSKFRRPENKEWSRKPPFELKYNSKARQRIAEYKKHIRKLGKWLVKKNVTNAYWGLNKLNNFPALARENKAFHEVRSQAFKFFGFKDENDFVASNALVVIDKYKKIYKKKK